MKHKFLRIKQLSNVLKVHPTTIRKWVKNGFFIEGTKLGSKVVVWSEKDVSEWMQKQLQKAQNHAV